MVTSTLKGPVAFLDFTLVIKVSIPPVVVGEIKKLLQKGVIKYLKEDISTFSIEQERSFPMICRFSQD